MLDNDGCTVHSFMLQSMLANNGCAVHSVMLRACWTIMVAPSIVLCSSMLDNNGCTVHPWPICMFFEMRFDLGTLDSGERSLPFGLLVLISSCKTVKNNKTGSLTLLLT